MKTPRLYVGRVWHKRLRPRRHAFRYPVYYVMVDVDSLQGEPTGAIPSCLSVNRFNLFSLWRRDYGRAGSGASLKAEIAGLLADSGIRQVPARVMLVTMPRVLGYSFNPLSVYLCYDARDELRAVVYEVRNTFGEKHFYVSGAGGDADCVRHETAKAFYVSPFYPVEGRYRFQLRPCRDRFSVSIEYIGADGQRDLTASLSAAGVALTAGNLLRVFMRIPLETLKVTVAIHYEALRLWLKGVPTFTRTPAAEDNATRCRTL